MHAIKACRYGLMAYNTNDQWVGRSFNEYGEFSEGEVEIFKLLIKQGDIIADIGANIGAHTIPLAKLTGPTGLVYAFEPQRIAYYNLCTNITLNNLTNVVCLQQAVGERNGRIDVPELDYRKSNNFGGLDLNTSHPASSNCSVKMIALDSLGVAFNFLKVDVEGMETEALKGAEQLIRKHRPLLYVENDRHEKAAFLIRMIRSLGYQIYFHTPRMFNPNNTFYNFRNVFGNTVSVNMYCVPKDRESPVDPLKFGMIELKPEQTRVVLGNDADAAGKQIENMVDGITQNLLDMADAYAAGSFDCDKAMVCVNQAAVHKPNDWMVYNAAAPILTRFLRYEEALKYVEKSLENGGPTDVVFNKAVVLGGVGRHKESIKIYQEVIEKEPDNVNAHFNRGCDLLIQEQFEEGWKEYEWRMKLNNPTLKQFLSSLPERPMWDGTPLDGKKILVFIEQGVGDQIQFIRYLPYLKRLGCHVMLTCFKNMEKLLKGTDGIDELIVYSDEMYMPKDTNFDCMVSLLSLPYLLKMNIIPSCLRYLNPKDSDLNATEVFQDYQKMFKVGFAWCGSEIHQNDFTRSTFLKHFRPLAKMPQVALFSLQKGGQDRTWPDRGKVNLSDGAEGVSYIDLLPHLKDFNDTAKLIDALDLIVTVDTSIVHLAGALGKETLLLQTRNPEWRWFMNREDSPWYPSVRVLRGDQWGECIFKAKNIIEQKV